MISNQISSGLMIILKRRMTSESLYLSLCIGIEYINMNTISTPSRWKYVQNKSLKNLTTTDPVINQTYSTSFFCETFWCTIWRTSFLIEKSIPIITDVWDFISITTIIWIILISLVWSGLPLLKKNMYHHLINCNSMC